MFDLRIHRIIQIYSSLLKVRDVQYTIRKLQSVSNDKTDAMLTLIFAKQWCGYEDHTLL